MPRFSPAVCCSAAAAAMRDASELGKVIDIVSNWGRFASFIP
jgi:hypothetical protein